MFFVILFDFQLLLQQLDHLITYGHSLCHNTLLLSLSLLMLFYINQSHYVLIIQIYFSTAFFQFSNPVLVKASSDFFAGNFLNFIAYMQELQNTLLCVMWQCNQIYFWYHKRFIWDIEIQTLVSFFGNTVMHVQKVAQVQVSVWTSIFVASVEPYCFYKKLNFRNKLFRKTQ